MKSKPAVQVVAALAPAPRRAADEGAVETLRRHLASGMAGEHVVLDFLEDDLREVRTALSGVAAWLANVERSLAAGTPSQQQLLALALGGATGQRIEALSSAVASARRRLAQVAARM